MFPAGDDLPDDLPDPADIEAGYLRHVLRHILDAGVAVAQTISHEATARTGAIINGDTDPRDTTAADLATAYDRTARAVRRTVALYQRIGAAPKQARQKRTTARKQIIRAVEDAIERVPLHHATGESAPKADEDLRAELHAELLDRVDSPDLDDDILTRPIPDIIADICRDLGLAAQSAGTGWKRRTVAGQSPSGTEARETGPTRTAQAPHAAASRSHPPDQPTGNSARPTHAPAAQPRASPPPGL